MVLSLVIYLTLMIHIIRIKDLISINLTSSKQINLNSISINLPFLFLFKRISLNPLYFSQKNTFFFPS